MPKITNLEAPCWVVVRPDGLWHGPFSKDQQAQEFYDWKKAANQLIEGKYEVKQTTIGRILERIEQNAQEKMK